MLMLIGTVARNDYHDACMAEIPFFEGQRTYAHIRRKVDHEYDDAPPSSRKRHRVQDNLQNGPKSQPSRPS